MELRFLDFDYSEDGAGRGVFDAVAAVRAEQLDALHGEVSAVLAWAHEEFGEARPLDEEGEWDFDLSGAVETSVPQHMRFDPATAGLYVSAGPAGMARHVLSLSLSGSPAFCAALREQFQLEA
jgi:hypothetical protein